MNSSSYRGSRNIYLIQQRSVRWISSLQDVLVVFCFFVFDWCSLFKISAFSSVATLVCNINSSTLSLVLFLLLHNLVKTIIIIDLRIQAQNLPEFSVSHLLVTESSSEFSSNQWMLPVWDGTRDPEICNISSSKLQGWIKNNKNNKPISVTMAAYPSNINLGVPALDILDENSKNNFPLKCCRIDVVKGKNLTSSPKTVSSSQP